MTSALPFPLAQHYQISLSIITAIKAKQKESAKLVGLNDANRCFQSAAMKLVIKWKLPRAGKDLNVEQQWPLVAKNTLLSLRLFQVVPSKKGNDLFSQ